MISQALLKGRVVDEKLLGTAGMHLTSGVLIPLLLIATFVFQVGRIPAGTP